MDEKIIDEPCMKKAEIKEFDLLVRKVMDEENIDEEETIDGSVMKKDESYSFYDEVNCKAYDFQYWNITVHDIEKKKKGQEINKI